MEEMSFGLFVKKSREMAGGVVEAARNSEGKLFHKAGAVIVKFLVI